MPVNLPGPEKFAEIEAILAEHHTARPPEVVNETLIEALADPGPLVWAGQEYPVRRMGYIEGYHFHRLFLRIGDFHRDPPRDEERLKVWAELLAEIAHRAWGMLEPKPPQNPFQDASPRELGELVGNFLARATNPGASRVGRPAGKP